MGDANPRGLALKFSLPDGSTTDVVSHKFNGFPVGTSAEFRDLLLAIGASGGGAPKPTALDGLLSGRPIAKTFLTNQKPAPQSYATLSYFGVNAFAFTNAQGNRTFVGYRFVPVDGEAFTPAADLASKGADYLQSELPTRLANGPVVYTWYAQISSDPDVIGNPSVASPERRRLVKLGAIWLDRMAPDPAAAGKATLSRR